MTGSHLRVLGLAEFERDACVFPLAQERHALLLVYLALESPSPHDRDALAQIFCPHGSHSRSAAWVRQALAALSTWAQPGGAGSGALGWASASGLAQPDIASSAWLQLARHTVAIDTTRLAVDALRLLRIHQRVSGHQHRQLTGCPVCLPQLVEAAALVRGVPLAGLDAAGSDVLERWIHARRAELTDAARSIFAALVETRRRMGDHARTIDDVRQWLRLEPTDEAVHRLLIEALARHGSRAAALHHLDWFRQLASDRLGYELEPATLELERHIREGRMPRLPPQARPGSDITDPGRAALRDQIVAAINEAGQRLVSITGADGIGRATLARAVARIAAPLFSAGAAVLSLDAVDDDTTLMIRIGQALAVPFTHRDAAPVQLARCLARHDGLLVIDRLSPRLEIGPLLAWLLERAPRLTIVVATTQRIGLRAETVFALDGLADGPALQLFGAHATPGLSRLAPHQIHALCGALGGAPLAIVLAASSLDAADLPGLLRSIDAGAPGSSTVPRWSAPLFEHIWRRLSRAEQSMLGVLAMFCGPFDARDALRAAAPADASQDGAPDDGQRVLRLLLRRGLLHEIGANQPLELHPLVRREVGERLARDAAWLQRARAAHATHVLGQLSAGAIVTPNATSRRYAMQLGDSLSDIATAWRWAYETGAWHWLDASVATLIMIAIGNGWCGPVHRMLGAAAAGAGDDGRERATRLTVMASRVARHAGEPDAARDYDRRTLLTMPGTASDDLRAQVAIVESWYRRERGDHAGADALLTAVAQDAARHRMLHATTDVWLRRELGRMALARQDYDAAAAALRAALRGARQLDDTLTTVAVLNELATIAIAQGDHARALALLDDALLHARALGDASSLLATIERIATLRLQEMRDIDSTIALLEEGLEIDQRCIAPDQTWQLRALLVDALTRRGAYDAARRSVLAGLAHLDLEVDPWPIAFASAASYEWHVGNADAAAILWGVAMRGAQPRIRQHAETMLRMAQLRLGAAPSAQLAARAAGLSLRDCVRLIETRLA